MSKPVIAPHELVGMGVYVHNKLILVVVRLLNDKRGGLIVGLHVVAEIKLDDASNIGSIGLKAFI